MESALIVSCTDKNTAFFSEMLKAASINQIVLLKSCAEARRLIMDHDFDLVIVNSPLRDESGENFSRNIALNGSLQVILAVTNENFDETAAVCGEDGVLTISRPVNRDIFWSVLTLAKSAHNRMNRIQTDNSQIKNKIEDIRIVDRAKYILISYMKMNEQEAHRFIEKQAMDLRVTKRAIAEGILKTYEN
jgi:response regulator NasT